MLAPSASAVGSGSSPAVSTPQGTDVQAVAAIAAAYGIAPSLVLAVQPPASGALGTAAVPQLARGTPSFWEGGSGSSGTGGQSDIDGEEQLHQLLAMTAGTAQESHSSEGASESTAAEGRAALTGIR